MAAYLAIVFGIVGLLMFAFGTGKIVEVGRITFAASIFALMFAFAQRTVTLLR